MQLPHSWRIDKNSGRQESNMYTFWLQITLKWGDVFEAHPLRHEESTGNSIQAERKDCLALEITREEAKEKDFINLLTLKLHIDNTYSHLWINTEAAPKHK